MSSLIQVSDSNAIVYISTSSFFSQVRTVRDISGTRSSSNTITVSSVDGFTFSDGSSRQLIDTPYQSLTFTPSTGAILHKLPFTYNQSVDASTLTMTNLIGRGSTTIYDSFYLSTMSTTGPMNVQSLNVGSNLIYTQSNLVSTIGSIGQSYTSTIYFPIDTLGSIYISTASLVSTVLVIPYISSPHLISTVNGLGTPYFSTPSLVSTVIGFSNTYPLYTDLQSTVKALGTATPDLVPLISTPTFHSTVSFFQTGFILSTSFTSTVSGLGTSAYISIPQLTSTVNGLGTSSYLSTSWLTSTVASMSSNFEQINTIYASTVNGLGETYLSTGGLIVATTTALTSNQSILTSTVNGLGTAGYVSVSQMTSTVNGLGQLYVSTSHLTSTVAGIFIYPLTVSTVQGLGDAIARNNGYISTLSQTSTVTGVLSNETVQLVSTVQGLGQSYFSVAQLASTVNGLGQSYISTPQFLASNGTFFATLYTQAQLTSSWMNLGTIGYMSIASVTSTFQGLGSPPARYISSTSLVSTVAGLAFSTVPNLTAAVAPTQVTNSNNFSNSVISIITSAANSPYSYISSYLTYSIQYATASMTVLTSTTTGVIARIGSQPAATTTTLTIPASNVLFTYSNGLQPSLVRVSGAGFSFCNIYCYQGITAAGFRATNYYADGTQLVFSSDRRLKEDIVPLSNALSIVQALEGVSYHRNERQLGFIAQDVEHILPDLVTTDEETYKSLSYYPICVVILEAIKELNAQCDALEQRLNLP